MSIDFDRQIKDFIRPKRVIKEPEDNIKPVSYINVYHQKNSLSLSHMSSSNFKKVTNSVFTTPTPSVQPHVKSSYSTKSVKIFHKQPTIAKEAAKTPIKPSILATKLPMTLESLSKMQPKESIIFNQVKSLSQSKPKPKQSSEPIIKKDSIKLKHIKNIRFKKMSTMRRMLSETNLEPALETKEEKLSTSGIITAVKEKRVSLKNQTWCWKGAEGSIIY